MYLLRYLSKYIFYIFFFFSYLNCFLFAVNKRQNVFPLDEKQYERECVSVVACVFVHVRRYPYNRKLDSEPNMGSARAKKCFWKLISSLNLTGKCEEIHIVSHVQLICVPTEVFSYWNSRTRNIETTTNLAVYTVFHRISSKRSNNHSGR